MNKNKQQWIEIVFVSAITIILIHPILFVASLILCAILQKESLGSIKIAIYILIFISPILNSGILPLSFILYKVIINNCSKWLSNILLVVSFFITTPIPLLFTFLTNNREHGSEFTSLVILVSSSLASSLLVLPIRYLVKKMIHKKYIDTRTTLAKNDSLILFSDIPSIKIVDIWVAENNENTFLKYYIETHEYYIYLKPLEIKNSKSIVLYAPSNIPPEASRLSLKFPLNKDACLFKEAMDYISCIKTNEERLTIFLKNGAMILVPISSSSKQNQEIKIISSQEIPPSYNTTLERDVIGLTLK